MILLKVEYFFDSNTITFEFEFEDGEPKESSSKMVKRNFSIKLPNINSLDEIHNDHLALSSYLVIRPWIKEKIQFGRPVSKKFADSLKKFNLKITPIDDALPSYENDSGKYAALAFSGGADSTAALSVLPRTTIPIFLNRPITRFTRYKKEAALHACNTISKAGFDCWIVDCDLELLRDPVGFPTDLSNGVPAILLSQKLAIFTICYGTILESLYSLGRLKFKEYIQTSHWKMWWNVFESAGLPLSFPVGGISEVGTEIICSKSNLGILAQSCIRGKVGEPCMNCWKCFRKTTVRNGLGISEYNTRMMNRLIKTKEVKKKLASLPVSHENVLLFSLSRLNLDALPPSFISRFENEFNLDYLQKWLPDSIEFVHPRIQLEVKKNISKFLEEMDSNEISLLKSWDNTKRIAGKQKLVL